MIITKITKFSFPTTIHFGEMAATLEDLAGVIHPHPTISESILEAALGAAGKPLHVHRRTAPAE